MTIKNLGKNCPVSMLYNIAEPDKVYDKCHHLLNHLRRLKFPTFIKWTSPFSSSGLLVLFFILIQILIEHPVS